MTLPHCRWAFREMRAGWLLMAVALIASGCAPRPYRVADVPPGYAALPAANLDTVNLSRLADANGTSDVIDWGDLLSVEIDSGMPSVPPRISTVRVAKDGTAGIPLVGRVAVAGLEVERAEQAIAAASRARDVFPNAFVSLRLVETSQEPGDRGRRGRDAGGFSAAARGQFADGGAGGRRGAERGRQRRRRDPAHRSAVDRARRPGSESAGGAASRVSPSASRTRRRCRPTARWFT